VELNANGGRPLKWSLKNKIEVECWYAYGFGFEVEWSPLFRGVYFKFLCFGVHVGWWKQENWLHRKTEENPVVRQVGLGEDWLEKQSIARRKLGEEHGTNS